jgi:hypothetical protein
MSLVFVILLEKLLDLLLKSLAVPVELKRNSSVHLNIMKNHKLQVPRGGPSLGSKIFFLVIYSLCGPFKPNSGHFVGSIL